jgi:ribosomal protein S18 acetylase RimI-like enzyme
LERSYAQSLDCPELTGVRTTSDVLAGHRATGEFDPGLWSVAMRGEEPVGILLLAPIPNASIAELVYCGVAQPARRKGVAHALLLRALTLTRSVSATSLTLAVDHRNVPARRLYDRWQFVPFAARAAWIATPLQ